MAGDTGTPYFLKLLQPLVSFVIHIWVIALWLASVSCWIHGDDGDVAFTLTEIIPSRGHKCVDQQVQEDAIEAWRADPCL